MNERCGTTKAPKGWVCTRVAGHDGPCAAILQLPWYKRALAAAGEAIGQALFGGQR